MNSTSIYILVALHPIITLTNMPNTAMEATELLKEIQTQLRLSMIVAVSQSMREIGLVYKLNFGVELPRIKSIAAAYEKDHALAQALWKEDIRECKI